MPKASVNQRLQRAKSLEKKGAHEEARALYAAILGEFPNNKRAQDALGGDGATQTAGHPPKDRISGLMALYGAGQFKETVAQAAPLAQAFPSSFVVWNILGAALTQTGEKLQAARAYQKAAALNPRDPTVHFNMGVTLHDLDRPVDALACYARALKLKPDYGDAHNNMGNILKQQGKFNAAISAYQRALALDQGNAGACNNLGTALKAIGKVPEAIAMYERAVAIAPNYGDAFNNLGVALERQNKPEAAIAALQQALRHNPNHTEAYINIARVLIAQGDPIKAGAAYLRANKIDPSNPEILSGLGLALRAQDKPRAALQAFQRAVARDPFYVQAHHNMGNLLSTQGDITAAMKAYRKALALAPDDVEIAADLIKVPTGLLDTELLDALGALFEKHPSTSANATFAQAHYLRHRGQVQAAFDQIFAINAAIAKQHEQDIAQQQAVRDAYLKTLLAWVPSVDEAGGETLKKLVILGPSRSGKSLLETLLGHDETVFQMFETIKASQQSIDALRAFNETPLLQDGKRAITLANPHLSQAIHHVADQISHAYFIFVARPHTDLGAEIFTKHYQEENYYSYDKLAILSYLTWYDQIAAIMLQKLPMRTLMLDFADVLRDPDAVLAKINRCTGLDLKPDKDALDLSAIALESGYAQAFEKLP